MVLVLVSVLVLVHLQLLYLKLWLLWLLWLPCARQHHSLPKHRSCVAHGRDGACVEKLAAAGVAAAPCAADAEAPSFGWGCCCVLLYAPAFAAHTTPHVGDASKSGI